jgi:hypothetical protein
MKLRTSRDRVTGEDRLEKGSQSARHFWATGYIHTISDPSGRAKIAGGEEEGIRAMVRFADAK